MTFQSISPHQKSDFQYEKNIESEAMLNMGRQFMGTLGGKPLTEETLASARAANIFIG